MQTEAANVARKRNGTRIRTANARGRAEFAKQISNAWQEQVESIIAVGTMLETASEELPPDEYKAMIREDLPFKRQTVFRLKKIAMNDVIRNVAHAQHLPASWMTLYELTKLTDEQIESGIKSGAINPKMERKHAIALRGPKPAGAERAFFGPAANCVLEVRKRISIALHDPAIDRSELFRMLREQLDRIEWEESHEQKEGNSAR